jgi:hypothetical protein
MKHNIMNIYENLLIMATSFKTVALAIILAFIAHGAIKIEQMVVI